MLTAHRRKPLNVTSIIVTEGIGNRYAGTVAKYSTIPSVVGNPIKVRKPSISCKREKGVTK